MKKRVSNVSFAIAITALGLALGMIASSPSSPALAQQEQIYAGQLMTQQERDEFRAKMHAALSNEEREQIRWEHHLKMQERAKERGIVLPGEPPMLGMRQRPGWGDGQGPRRLPKGGGRRGG